MDAEPLLGAHMSIAGGIHNAFHRAERAGCRTLQIFLKNSNQWKGRALSDHDRELCLEVRKRTGIRPVVAHCAYLINLASPDDALRRRSFNAFIDEMERANFLAVPYLVLHPGAHKGAGETAGIKSVAAALNMAFDAVPPPVQVVLENTAGQGTCLGHRFEHLAAIRDMVRCTGRLGFCLDTCHLFAAGYDIRTGKAYRRTLREFDRLVGLDGIRVFHINDSRRGLGSRVDRHAHIGQGLLGFESFRNLLKDRRFAEVPKILETPKGPNLAEDVRNLEILRSLLR